MVTSCGGQRFIFSVSLLIVDADSNVPSISHSARGEPGNRTRKNTSREIIKPAVKRKKYLKHWA